MPPVILITRPAPFGAEFAATLRAHPGGDLRVVLSPVMRIEPCGTVPDLDGIAWLIFTSRNGVAQFAARSTRRDIACYAVGDATADEARGHGMCAISSSGDARDLLAQIARDGACGPMLHLRGAHAAADIAGALEVAGIEAREAVIYRQISEALTQEARDCLSGPQPVIAPLFSPRSAAALFAESRLDAPIVALAISSAAAGRIPAGAAARVIVAGKPDAAGILRAWPEALAEAYRLEGTDCAE